MLSPCRTGRAQTKPISHCDGFSPLCPSILRALCRGAEIAQIRRLLAFAGGHQVAIAAEKIILLANDHVHVALGAVVLRPPHIAVATITLHYRPWPRQCAVGRGDFV